MTTMDDSPSLFNIFFNRMVVTIKEIFKGEQNFTIVNNFNKNCTDDMDCEDFSLFCNLTAKKCLCTRFHSLNKNASVCDFQLANFTSWVKNNSTKENNPNNNYNIHNEHPITTFLAEHWTITATIVIGILCLFLCAIYACFTDKDKKNPLESQVLHTKQREHSNRIMQENQMPIRKSDCKINRF